MTSVSCRCACECEAEVNDSQSGICWWCRHRIHYPLDSEPAILILDTGEVIADGH